jgi:hypothetical protein
VKLRKPIEEFAVKAIGADFVTLIGADGYEYRLRVRDRIAVDHQIEVVGANDGVQEVAKYLIAIGFDEVPALPLQ